jgi:serine/threonine protein kinase
MPIGSILSHYQIQRVLGEGGMGIVYSAIDQRDGTIVAIKELKKTIAGDKELQLRFQQEARTMSSLKHINIV